MCMAARLTGELQSGVGAAANRQTDRQTTKQTDRQTDRRVCSIGPFVATGLQGMLGAVQVGPHDLQQGQESHWETRQRTFSFCGRADRYCSGSQRE